MSNSGYVFEKLYRAFFCLVGDGPFNKCLSGAALVLHSLDDNDLKSIAKEFAIDFRSH